MVEKIVGRMWIGGIVSVSAAGRRRICGAARGTLKDMLSARALPQILPILATLALGWSTAAVAETEATGTVAPPIQVEAYRLTASDAAGAMRTDVRALSGGSVFADDTGRAMLGRTRFLGTAPWGTALTIEMSRPALSGLRRS